MTLAQFLKFAGAALQAAMGGLSPGSWPAVVVSLLMSAVAAYAAANGTPVALPSQAAGPPPELPPESDWTPEGIKKYAKSCCKAK